MPLWQKYLNKLSTIIPVGAVGAAMLLGSALPTDASAGPSSAQYPRSDGGISERLAAIRHAASVAIEPTGGITQTDPNIQLAWGNWWNNWRPRWNNFRPRWNNWRNAWRNW